MTELEKYWLEKYQQDKVGTIAKLSQAMQHMAWLREWQRIHGDSPRIKPITEKVNGEKKKVGEANIAVPWSKLDDFFKKGNEYGDIETVKFLAEKIEQGDISELTEEQLLELAEKENVKWSDGKHSLNPLQGYLYDFVKKGAYILETPLGEQDYGKFYPITEYLAGVKPGDLDFYEDKKDNEVHKAFSRYYTTRLMQDILSKMPDSKYADFVNFDITSVTTPEQIEELDKKLAEIVQSPEIQDEMEELEGDKEYEAMIYERLKQEIETEIKKDTDRIKNAHKVFVALESRNLEEIFQDEETLKWAEQIKSREITEEKAKVTPKDIAETDKGQALTTAEIGGIKGFFKRLMDKIKGKGEK